MPVSLPAVKADRPDRTLRLQDLRDLVAASEHLDADLIVRGAAVPFKMNDLGNQLGGCIEKLALDIEETP